MDVKIRCTECKWTGVLDDAIGVRNGDEKFPENFSCQQCGNAVEVLEPAEAGTLSTEGANESIVPAKTRPWRVKIYTDVSGQKRWKLLSSNGKIIADGAEGYKTVDKLMQTLDQIRDGSKLREAKVEFE